MNAPTLDERIKAAMLRYVQKNDNASAIEVTNYEDRMESWSYSSYTAGQDYYVDIDFRYRAMDGSIRSKTHSYSGRFSDLIRALTDVE